MGTARLPTVRVLEAQGKFHVAVLNWIEWNLPDRTMCEDNGIFLGVFEDDLPPRMEPHPTVVLALHPEVHRLNLLCVDHCNLTEFFLKLHIVGNVSKKGLHRG